MKELLAKIPPRELVRALGAKELRAAASLVGVDPDQIGDWVAGYAWNLHGRALIRNKRVRSLLMALLDEDVLASLAATHTRTRFSKRQDNLFALSSLPWRSGSKFAAQLVRELGLSSEYIPARGRSGNPTEEVIEPSDPLPKLHEYQDRVRHEIVKALSGDDPSFLVQMPTGSGKTRTAVEGLIEQIQSCNYFEGGDTILWLAHTEELCEQAIDVLKDLWTVRGRSSLRLVRMWGGHRVDPIEVNGSFLIGTYQTLASLYRRNAEMRSQLECRVRIVVADEAHKALAPTYESAIAGLKTAGAKIVGLTATPGRGLEADEENRRLARLFENRLITPGFHGNAISELRELGVLSLVDRVVIDTGIRVEMTDSDHESLLKTSDLSRSVIARLADHPERNRRILDQVISEVNGGNPTLVFTCTTAHSRLLAAALAMRGVRSAYVDCSTPRGSRRSVIERFKQGELDVILNFGVLSTGFDAPRIRSVVITRPTASVVLYSQMVGRGLRGPKMGGGERCRLIDVKDNLESFGVVEDVYACFSEYWT